MMDSTLGLSVDTLVRRILYDYFRVPSGSQPLLTDLTESVGLGFKDNRRRHSQRKVSLECSSMETDAEGDVSSICLVNVELPSVEDAEKMHPLLMEQDATPFLELDDSNSVRKIYLFISFFYFGSKSQFNR